MSNQAIDISLVGRGDAQRGFEIFASEGESMGAVMGSADDDEERGVGLLEDFFEAPGETMAAAMVVNMGNERGSEWRAGLRSHSKWRAGLRKRPEWFSRQPRTFRISEQALELAAHRFRFGRIGADASRLANRAAQPLLKTRSVEEQGGVQSLHQGNEKLQRQEHAAELAHGLGLDVAQRIPAVEHL